jgi:uncharacterized membrane protein YfcA
MVQFVAGVFCGLFFGAVVGVLVLRRLNNETLRTLSAVTAILEDVADVLAKLVIENSKGKSPRRNYFEK